MDRAIENMRTNLERIQALNRDLARLNEETKELLHRAQHRFWREPAGTSHGNSHSCQLGTTESRLTELDEITCVLSEKAAVQGEYYHG